MTEIWRDIPEWEGLYQVSTSGGVRSMDRVVYAGSRNGKARTRLAKGRVLSPGKNVVSGYLHVMLNDKATGRQKSCNVHALVAATFLGPRPEGLEVRHLDGDPSNASLVNLAYGTHRENMDDCVKHGTRANGDVLPHAVSREQAADIRKRLSSENISQRSLARQLGINRTTIMKIAGNRHWSNYGS